MRNLYDIMHLYTNICMATFIDINIYLCNSGGAKFRMDVQYFSVEIYFYWYCWWTKHGTPVEMAKTASHMIYTITFIRIWFWIMKYLNIWWPYVPSRFKMFPFHWTNHEDNGLGSKKWSDHSWPSLFISCFIEHNQDDKTEIPLHNIQPTLITLAKHNITITTTLSPICSVMNKNCPPCRNPGTANFGTDPPQANSTWHANVPDGQMFALMKIMKRWNVKVTRNNTCLVKH